MHNSSSYTMPYVIEEDRERIDKAATEIAAALIENRIGYCEVDIAFACATHKLGITQKL